MMPQSDFGICDRINHLMNEKCLTAAEFAKKTTIPYKTVNQYCNYINSPSTANLKKIAIHMNVSAEKKKPDKKIAISPNTYKKYFTDKSNDEIQQIVEQALEMFYSDRKEHT